MRAPQGADRKQRRGELGDELADLALKLVDLRSQRTAAIDELTRDPCHRSIEVRETRAEPVEVAEMVERSESRFVAGIEFVEMPAKAG